MSCADCIYILTRACAGVGELEKRLAGLGNQVEELRRLFLYSDFAHAQELVS
jgi:hypothetical protein